MCIEIVISIDGLINCLVQVKILLLFGEKDGIDGVWYCVCFDLVGEMLIVYLDGEEMGLVMDSMFIVKGLIGMFINNCLFEMDDFKVGDLIVKFVQLMLDYKDIIWDIIMISDLLYVYVIVVKNDGVIDDMFIVILFKDSVVMVIVDGLNVILMLVGVGSVIIIFILGLDVMLICSIEVMVIEGFVMLLSEYGDFIGKVLFVLVLIGVYIDGKLMLIFDSVFMLGEVGEVCIYNVVDDMVVDVIFFGGEINVLGYSGQDCLCWVNYCVFNVEGNILMIVFYNNVFDYD